MQNKAVFRHLGSLSCHQVKYKNTRNPFIGRTCVVILLSLEALGAVAATATRRALRTALALRSSTQLGEH